MALKIEQECDFSGKRASVKLPTDGPLDLSKIPLPEGWTTRPGIAGVTEDEELILCPEAAEVYDKALDSVQVAIKQVWEGAMRQARKQAQPAPAAPATGGVHRSSSFAGAR